LTLATLLLSALFLAPADSAAAGKNPRPWLDDDSALAVRDWVSTRDKAARAALQSRPGRAARRGQLDALLSSGTLQGATLRGKRLFYLKRAGLHERPILYARDLPQTESRLVLDTARLDAEGFEALAWWQPSPDGLLLAYGARQPGGDCELRVREVDSAADLPDRISRAPEASVAWRADRTGFYYTRDPLPGTSAPRQVRLHIMGTDPAHDQLVFTARSVQELPQAQLSADGRLLLLALRDKTPPAEAPARGGELFLKDLASGPSEFSALPVDHCVRAKFLGRTLYALADEEPGQAGILAVDLRQPGKPRLRKIVAPGPLPIADFEPFAAGLAVLVEEHSASRLRLHDRKGRPLREIPIPQGGSVSCLTGAGASTDFFFVWESFFSAPILYRYETRDAVLSIVDSVPGPDPEEFQLERLKSSAQDGRPATFFLASQRWLKRDRQNKILLAIADNCEMLPRYSPELIHWAELGGIYALPGAGACSNVAALLAAAQELVRRESTRPGLLAVSGSGRGARAALDAAAAQPGLFSALILEQPAELPAARPENLPPTLILAGPCPQGAPAKLSRQTAAALEIKSSAGDQPLFRWEPLGCGDIPVSRALDKILDMETFLLWKTAADKPAQPPI